MDSLDTKVYAVDNPFRTANVCMFAPIGIDCLELLEKVQPNPYLARNAVITINERVVQKIEWETTCIKKNDRVLIRLMPVVPMGGGGGKIVRDILSIAIIAASFTLGGMAAGAYIAGSWQAAVVGAAVFTGVSMVGTMALNMICPPPTSDRSIGGSASVKDATVYSLETASNSARFYEVVPKVLGFFRHVPPLAARTYTSIYGNDQDLTMCIGWSTGRTNIYDIKIGETDIDDYDDVDYETKNGFSGDSDFTLYPNQVIEEAFSIEMTNAASWQTRTTELNTDRAYIDVSFSGLVRFGNGNEKYSRSVTFQYQYAVKDSGSWTGTTSFTVTAARTSLVRKTKRITFPSRGQYDVRLRRTTADTDSSLILDEGYWISLKSWTNEDPIETDFYMAASAIRALAGQFASGNLDNVSGECRTVCLDYVGSDWIEQETNYCASLYRHVLQCEANPEPVDDADIDLTALEEWHDFCVLHDLRYNNVLNSQMAIPQLLDAIASAGMAFRTTVDGKWSISIDNERTDSVQLITPRNSINFVSSKNYKDIPHAFRITFNNEDNDHVLDEMLVYHDDYTESTATYIEDLDLPGVTNSDQVFKLARYYLACLILRPETFSVEMDYEFLCCNRGVKVDLAIPHALIGVAQGRITELITDSNGYVESIVLDEYCEEESGEDYGVRIRSTDGTSTTYPVSGVSGDGYQLDLITPIESDLPVVGDLCAFGVEDLEVVPCIVKNVMPNSATDARIEMVNYDEGILASLTEDIPAFNSYITPLTKPDAPIVTSIKSNETVMVRTPGGGLQTRVVINLKAISYRYRIHARYKLYEDEDYQMAEIASRSQDQIVLTGVDDGLRYNIKLWYEDETGINGTETLITHLVQGQLSAPAGLTSFTINAIGGLAILRWDQLSEIDVIYGGKIEIRHAPLETSYWNESIPIGDAAKGNDTQAFVPLKAGKYFARVFDAGGRPCEPEDIAEFYTKQATILGYANLDTLNESSGGFDGTHDGTVENGTGYLEIDQDSSGNLDGTYYFESGIDLLAVESFRLTTYVEALVVNNTSTIDDKTTYIDTWEDFDDTYSASGLDAFIYVRTTDDDPDSSDPDWSAWQRIDSGEFLARGMEFKIYLSSETEDYNINIISLIIYVEELA